jgi:Transcription factor WhiB
MAIPPDQLPLPQEGWQTDPRRACVGLTELYFPPRGESRPIRWRTDAICAGCVVRVSCLTWSLLESDLHGLAAQVSPSERRRYRRKYKVRAPTQPTVEGVLRGWIAALAQRRQQPTA